MRFRSHPRVGAVTRRAPLAPRPSPKMLGSMTEPTSTADLLKGDLSRHSLMKAQYLRVTFQAA